MVHNLTRYLGMLDHVFGNVGGDPKSCTPSFFFFGQLLVHIYIGHLPVVNEQHVGDQSGTRLTNGGWNLRVMLVPIATEGFLPRPMRQATLYETTHPGPPLCASSRQPRRQPLCQLLNRYQSCPEGVQPRPAGTLR